MILKDRLGHYMEYRHKGEILIQVKDDGGLDNVPASGWRERWTGKDLLMGMVGVGEIKFDSWDSNLSNSVNGVITAEGQAKR